MKKIMLPLFAALFFAACQNSTPAPTADTQDMPAAVKIEPAQIQEASAKATIALQNMDNLQKEINAAYTTTNESQKSQLDAVRSELNDVMTKQETMIKGLKMATDVGSAESDGAVPTPGVLQDYIQSATSYDKLVEEMRGRVESIKSGKPANQ
jgi:transglutaminase/protease-like cytokinesis protein 3